jgi:hypothetical protein
MKKLLLLTIVGAAVSGSAGCRFMDCLFRGGPARQPTCQPVTTVTCTPNCAPANACDPCGAPAVTNPIPTPGVAPYGTSGSTR